MTAEEKRLEQARTHQQHWRRWGSYLSERQWGTVREDYSKYGTAWDYFPHDHARSRAYRWGEDGIAGISDNHQRLCFAIALWNGKDPILKERIFGLTGSEGNHGEDVKEYYFYLDNTPTHAYMKYLYKYPQQEFPYNELVVANRDRSKTEPEFELLDTGIFDNDDYFDVFVEYAKASDEDILIQIHVVNRGNNVFQGGFLGLDNIGVFDRSAELPMGGHIDQSDGTSWMGMYCLNMLAIALELALENPAYEDMASKFFEHFLYIADAMNHIGDTDIHLWDDRDGFYYDVLQFPQGDRVHLKVRSMVGLVPLFAVEILTPEILAKLPHFKRRMEWFIRNRPDLKRNIACMEKKGVGARRILSIVNQEKLKRILQKMLDETEFLSDYGIRSLSKFHQKNPYIFECEGNWNQVNYEPAESTTGMFGGNSNWRGPIWFPMNFLIIESLCKFHNYFGDNFKVEYPSNSGQEITLKQLAKELSQRLIKIFAKNSANERPVYHNIEKFQTDPNWHNLILFHEYFNGDTGAGLGANHQTGWTGLIAKLVQNCG